MINYSIVVMGTTPGTKKENIQETKAYGTAQCSEVLDINEFAEHITSHGCAYDKGDIIAIINKTVGCLRHLMLDGKRVRLGDLGDFHVELVTEGAATCDDFTAQNIKDVNVRWTPGKEFRNLRQVATFQLVPCRLDQANSLKEIKNQETIQGME